jgi:transcription initiation factor IIF auxiliary subunit
MCLLSWGHSPSSKARKLMKIILISKLIDDLAIIIHRWSCYVRGLNNDEDISYFIKKVVFQLHPSFPEPVKTVEKFPFEIHQTGWGEFDISIKIFFVDPSERPIEMLHALKLHPEAG